MWNKTNDKEGRKFYFSKPKKERKEEDALWGRITYGTPYYDLAPAKQPYYGGFIKSLYNYIMVIWTSYFFVLKLHLLCYLWFYMVIFQRRVNNLLVIKNPTIRFFNFLWKTFFYFFLTLIYPWYLITFFFIMHILYLVFHAFLFYIFIQYSNIYNTYFLAMYFTFNDKCESIWFYLLISCVCKNCCHHFLLKSLF